VTTKEKLVSQLAQEQSSAQYDVSLFDKPQEDSSANTTTNHFDPRAKREQKRKNASLKKRVFELARHAEDQVQEAKRGKRRGAQAASSHYLSSKHSRVRDYDAATSDEEDGLSYAGSSFDFDKYDAEERDIYMQIKAEE